MADLTGQWPGILALLLFVVVVGSYLTLRGSTEYLGEPELDPDERRSELARSYALRAVGTVVTSVAAAAVALGWR